MNRSAFLPALLLAAATASPALAQQQGQQQSGQSATAQFIDAKGQQIGQATLRQTPNGVLIEAEVSGLPAGPHAFHVHETGKCDPADGFKSAGGHYAGGADKHGFEVEGGPHAGDMPNQHVPEGGKLMAEVVNDRVSLGGGEGDLFDDDGSALVIHAKADDYRSQPAGDAGDRLACAVIEKAG